jgi:hypothetical protein
MNGTAIGVQELTCQLLDAADGIPADTAAARPIISHGHFLHRDAFRRTITAGTSISTGQPLAAISWDAALHALEAGCWPAHPPSKPSCGSPPASATPPSPSTCAPSSATSTPATSPWSPPPLPPPTAKPRSSPGRRAGRPGPQERARQDQRPAGGADRALHRSPRLHAGHDAGPDRRAHHPDRYPHHAYSDDSDRSVRCFRSGWVGGRVAADAGCPGPRFSPPSGSGRSVPWAGGPGLMRRA